MMSEIKCPACQNGIIMIDSQALLAGASFSCNSCGAALAVAASGKETLQKGVEEFAELQQRIASQSPPG